MERQQFTRASLGTAARVFHGWDNRHGAVVDTPAAHVHWPNWAKYRTQCPRLAWRTRSSVILDQPTRCDEMYWLNYNAGQHAGETGHALWNVAIQGHVIPEARRLLSTAVVLS
ncbi:MAG: hypothetical protein ACRDQ4_18895 [Pseudonocardiaceae bacterium]